jgi:hypothetical protein
MSVQARQNQCRRFCGHRRLDKDHLYEELREVAVGLKSKRLVIEGHYEAGDFLNDQSDLWLRRSIWGYGGSVASGNVDRTPNR